MCYNKVKLLVLLYSCIFLPFIQGYAQSDLEMKNFGPSRGRVPQSYANQIQDNLGSLYYAKFYANKAIGYFLDDDCPLPKNLVGNFKDENGNDAASMYRANEGCNTFMNALFRLYLAFPDDDECKTYLDRVVRFADCMLEYGTDRYGSVHTPLLASILMRDKEPYVPFDPQNPERGVRIEQRNVYSYTDNKVVYNYCAISLGNIWYDSDESHKSCWRGSDLEANNDLYTLLYSLSKNLDKSKYPDRDKYKKAADASLAFWTNHCQTESNMYPWGEHAGWDFYRDRYNDDYYHAPLHEYKGEFRTNLDKLIENQARVRPGEMTSFEKYATGLKAAHTAEADYGNRYNGYMLEGMFLFCRHGTLWTDRLTARYQENNQDVGGSFGCFPKHIGSYLYVMALAYNRSHNQQIRDSIARNLNFFLDGIEHQKLVYTSGKYYPYGTFNWKGYPTGSSAISKTQNGDLGIFAKRASAYMDGLDNNIRDKMLLVANNTGTASIYPYTPYPGPALVTPSFPQEGYTVHNSKSSVKLAWLPSEGATKYRIYLSDGERRTAQATPDSTAFVVETTGTDYTVEGLIPDKRYYWAVDAITSEGDVTKGYMLLLNTSSGQPTLVQKVTLPSELNIQVFDTTTLVPAFEPSNASNPFVSWESSDESIAVVNTEGKVTAKIAGTVTIKATSVDEKVTAECLVHVNSLAQEISFDPISTQYLDQNTFLMLEASASSGLPVYYDVISGPAKLQKESSYDIAESAYVNSKKLTYKNPLRMNVNGMQILFQLDMTGVDVSQSEHIFFQYTTVEDGTHLRNYDVNVHMIEYPTGWIPGENVPDPVSTNPVSNTIVQPKIPAESSFPSSQAYLAAYQKPILLDITDFVTGKLANGQTKFCIALCPSKVNDSDGSEYVRIASHLHSDENLRPKVLTFNEGEGNTLTLTGTGEVKVKASQGGDNVYRAAEEIIRVFEVKSENSSLNSWSQEERVSIFPNPFTGGNLNVLVQETDAKSLQIYQVDGVSVYRENIEKNKNILVPYSLFKPGLYIVTIQPEKQAQNYKLIVK